MNSIFKRIIFLWTILFSPFLFADGAIVNIHINDVTANESAGTMTFTISLSETPILPVTVDFNTIDGSAQAGTDYVAKTDYLLFGLGISSRTFTIDIINDSVYETTQNFYINMSSSSSGYVSSYDGTGTITDDDVQPLSISVLGKSITEGDSNSTTSFTVQVNQPAPTGGLTIDYTTDVYTGTAYDPAVAGEDYTTTSGTLTINEGATIGYISIPIIADMNPESTEIFLVKLTSVNQGTITTDEAVGTIYDDDEIRVNISVTDTLEGNTSSSNQMQFKIFLTKPYPLTTPLTIDYETQDGFSPSAVASSDYVTKTGSVTFNSGESEKLVYVDIIGDNDIESDENLEMVISGSSYIGSHSTVAGEILNDDGSFPGLSFSPTSGATNFEIIEGNSSQSDLNFIMTLDAPAIAGTSFDYYTQNNTATATSGDYVQVPLTTYNVPVGATSVSIPVSINGDTEIEGDESFYFRIENEVNLNIVGHLATGNIINDDGSYPILSFNLDSYEVIEGNSSSKTIDFQLQLDKPAWANSSFDYYTANGTATIDNSDYVEINRTTYTFSGEEQNITISVTVNGDNDFEPTEEFYLKIDNEINVTIVGTQNPSGVILNDDEEEFPFTCEENSFISFNLESSATSGDSMFNTILLADGSLLSSDIVTNVNGVNSIGYNIQDNFIWGYNLNLNKVVRINNQKQAKIYDIAGLTSRFYVAADVDKDGILYLFSREDSIERRTLVTIDLNTLTVLTSVTLNQEINTADMAFNPIDGNLYFIEDDTSSLYKITLSTDKLTGTVSLVGDTGIGTITPIINFFDKDGNFYFNKDLASIYKIDVLTSSTATWFSNLDAQLRNGDGARCANAPVTIPRSDDESFTCDNSMYLSSSIKRGTGETGKMWLHKIDTSKNPFEFIPIDETGETKLYNALAYADSGDINTSDYIFGIYNDEINKTHELIKLSATGKIINLGVIGGFPTTLDTKQLFAGAIYGDFYYVSGPGVDYDKIFKIDLRDKSMSEITLDKAVSLLDFSFTPDGKFLHGIIDGGELVKIDLSVSPSTVTIIGSPHTGYQFDSTFSDNTGRFFANDSKGNGFFEFNLITGNKLFLSNSQEASFNDGANCLQASLVFTDYGDAPLSYESPRHNIANGIFMGDNVDHDIEAFHSDDADGDDTNGTDDEDGVTLFDGSSLNNSYFPLGETHKLKIKVSKAGFLNMWIDFDADGTFDSGDQIITAGSLTAGEHTLTFTIPNTANTTKPSYMRFRFSSTAVLNATEDATDGEIEDYMVHLGSEFTPLKGLFNIERTNSNSYSINSDERNAWYTQIASRDFDYSILFYEENLSAQKEVDRVVIKLELVDMESNTSLYERYFYIKNTPPVSRKDIIIATDLDTLPATRDARFRVSYGIDNEGSLLQIDCDTLEEECYDTLPKIRTDYAKDNFAIRPETFYIKVADGNQEISNSRHMEEILRVASGYEYNLTMIATKYGSMEPSLGYNKDFNASFELNATDMSSCLNTTPITEEIKYRDGIENILNFKHDNVGHYILTQVTDENWTAVDKDSNDCILNDANTSDSGNSKSGCNIKLQIHPINLEFYPDHFKVDLTMQNLPDSGHSDFIYMMELNATNNDVAIAFQGKIIAQSENNQTTTNFTTGCVATDILLDLNATTISDTGTNTPIRTEDNNDVNSSRVIIFNNETDETKFDVNRSLEKIGNIISITSDKFLNENNGTVQLDMRYNINKNLTKAINPVEVTFNTIKVNAIDANSVAHTTATYTPTGEKAFTNNVKNFYFARVVSNLNSYPRININISPYIRTPLNVDFYCRTIIPNYCQDRNVLTNTTITGTIREQNGWYLSTNHDGELDGNVTALIDNPNILTIMPDPTPSGADDIALEDGATGLINTIFNSCPKATPSSTVTIVTSPALTFNPSQYIVNCTDIDPSQWGGLGKTGNIINIKPRVDKSGKMDW